MLYRFGIFELDTSTAELRRGGRRVALQEQPMTVLLALVAEAGAVVERETLRHRLWPEDVHVDVDNGINTAVARLREALDDPAGNPRFVATVPRRGYRFIAPVERVVDSLPAAEIKAAEVKEPEQAPHETSRLIPGHVAAAMPAPPAKPSASAAVAPRSTLRFALSALMLVVSAALTWLVVSRRPPSNLEATRPGALRLAVLPFADLSTPTGVDVETRGAFLGPGLTEELILLLGRLAPERLRVIARTSVLPYRAGAQGAARAVAEIARELDVDFVLEGSVQREGDAVRITVALVEVAGQTRLWGAAYDRQMGSLMALEREIAQEVGVALALELAPELAPGLAIGPAHQQIQGRGHEHILEGHYFLGQRTEDGLRKAVQAFEAAIVEAPEAASAHAGLAAAWALLGIYDHAARDDALSRAATAVERALALDATSADAHLVRAALHFHFEWRFEDAGRALERAVALNPSLALAHLMAANLYASQGREADTVAALDRALALDPLSPTVHADACWKLFVVHREEAALARCHRAIELNPDFLDGWDVLKWIHIVRGEDAEAAEAFLRVVALERLHASEVEALRAVAEREGIDGLLRASLAHPERRLAESGQSPYNLALDHAVLGNTEAALDYLERAFAIRETDLVNLAVDPRLETLRDQPRFRALLDEVGLEAVRGRWDRNPPRLPEPRG